MGPARFPRTRGKLSLPRLPDNEPVVDEFSGFEPREYRGTGREREQRGHERKRKREEGSRDCEQVKRLPVTQSKAYPFHL